MGVTFIIGLGANLTDMCGRLPLSSCRRAVGSIVAALAGELSGASGWYRSAAVPRSDQPDFVNGVISVRSGVAPWDVLRALQRIEAEAGRVRGVRNAARVLDLDIVAVDEAVIESEALTVPHPRMAERAFVLHPLCEVAPGWRHPVLGLTATDLRDRLADPRLSGQWIERVAEAREGAHEALSSPGGTLR